MSPDTIKVFEEHVEKMVSASEKDLDGSSEGTEMAYLQGRIGACQEVIRVLNTIRVFTAGGRE